MDFSSSGGSSSEQISPAALKSHLQAQMAQAYAEELLENMRTRCFDKCIPKPGSSLGGSESSCVSRCMDRYIEATRLIGKSLMEYQG